MSFFDHNAGGPVDSRVAQAMVEFLSADSAGSANPSSPHAAGRRARDEVERARVEVASLVAAAPDDLVFTSGGTEANHLGVVGGALTARSARAAARTGRALLGATEHPSVLGTRRALELLGFEVVVAPCDADGRLNAAGLAAALGLPAGGARGWLPVSDVALIAIQVANHETGVLQPLDALVPWLRDTAPGAWIHVDAVQAVGRMPLTLAGTGADSIALSAHKLGGPQGVGALVLAPGRAPALLCGGGRQERGRRPGTENVPGIVGFGAAAAITRAERAAECARLEALRTRLEPRLLDLGGRIAGSGVPRLPNTTNVRFAGVLGEELMQSLDLEGIAVSTGAACSTGSTLPSPVLRAMGLSTGEARAALRISLGRGNSTDEVDRLLGLLPGLLERIRDARTRGGPPSG